MKKLILFAICLSFFNLVHGQNIPAYKYKVDTSVTFKAAPASITPKTIGNRLKELADIVQLVKDSSGSGSAVDTSSLSNRINQKQALTDTSTWDATRSWVNNNFLKPSALTANNGISKSGTNFSLGGDINVSTELNCNDHAFAITGASSADIYADKVNITGDTIVLNGAVILPINLIGLPYIYETTGTVSGIQSILDSIHYPINLILKNSTTYTQYDPILFHSYNWGTILEGNMATLKRGNQQTTTLSATASNVSTNVQVASIPSGWKKGDFLQIYTGNGRDSSTLYRGLIISSISGNTIYLKDSIGPDARLVNRSWPVGATVRKVYSQITGELIDTVGRFPNFYTKTNNYTIQNLSFDGNQNNNNGSYYWGVNRCVENSGHATIQHCNFHSIPGDCIYGSGFNLLYNTADSIYGSFYHMSGNIYRGDSVFGGDVTGNYVSNTNLSGEAVNGHTEGAITLSFSSGRANIHHNTFLYGKTGVLGTFQGSVDDAINGATRDMLFTNNVCRNFQYPIYAIGSSLSPNPVPGNILISQNVFDSCGSIDFSTQDLSRIDKFWIWNNQNSRGTKFLNQPSTFKPPLDTAFDRTITVNGDGWFNSIHCTELNVANGGRIRTQTNPGVNYMYFENATSGSSITAVLMTSDLLVFDQTASVYANVTAKNFIGDAIKCNPAHDSDVPNGVFFVGSDHSNKACFKDASGVVHVLY